MENRVAISTLTSRNKIDWLKKLNASVRGNMADVALDWHIYSNGSSPEQEEYLNYLHSEWFGPGLFQFNIRFGKENGGVGYGVNRAADMVKDYEFVLYLEDDWFHLPKELTDVTNDWLPKAINLFDKFPNLDLLLLRRYLYRSEADHHGFSRHFDSENFNEIDFQGLRILSSDFDYCNTPHLRRNKSLYDKGVYPVNQDAEARTEVKKVGGSFPSMPNKGWPEQIAKVRGRENGLVCWQLFPGIFAHEHSSVKIQEYCGKYNVGGTTCKYGFATIEPERFCDHCLHTDGLRYFNNHYERLVNG